MGVDDFHSWLTLLGLHPQTEHAVALRMHLPAPVESRAKTGKPRSTIQYNTVRKVYTSRRRKTQQLPFQPNSS